MWIGAVRAWPAAGVDALDEVRRGKGDSPRRHAAKWYQRLHGEEADAGHADHNALHDQIVRMHHIGAVAAAAVVGAVALAFCCYRAGAKGANRGRSSKKKRSGMTV